MAETIACCIGYDRNRIKKASRPGSVAARGGASTWRTCAECYVRQDGSGHVTVERDGKTLHRFEFGPED